MGPNFNDFCRKMLYLEESGIEEIVFIPTEVASNRCEGPFMVKIDPKDNGCMRLTYLSGDFAMFWDLRDDCGTMEIINLRRRRFENGRIEVILGGYIDGTDTW